MSISPPLFRARSTSEVVVALERSPGVEAYHHPLLDKPNKCCLICGCNVSSSLGSSSTLGDSLSSLQIKQKKLLGPLLFQHLELPKKRGRPSWWFCINCEDNLQQLGRLQARMTKMKIRIKGIINLLKLKVNPLPKRKACDKDAAAKGQGQRQGRGRGRSQGRGRSPPETVPKSNTGANNQNKPVVVETEPIASNQAHLEEDRSELNEDVKPLILEFEEELDFVEAEEQLTSLGRICNDGESKDANKGNGPGDNSTNIGRDPLEFCSGMSSITTNNESGLRSCSGSGSGQHLAQPPLFSLLFKTDAASQTDTVITSTETFDVINEQNDTSTSTSTVLTGNCHDNQFNRPRFILDTEALCDRCGTRSRNLHYCEYCMCKIADNPKFFTLTEPNLGNGKLISVIPRILSASRATIPTIAGCYISPSEKSKRPTKPNLGNGKPTSVISCILPASSITTTKAGCDNDIPPSEKSKRPTEPNLGNGQPNSVISCVLPGSSITATEAGCNNDIPPSEQSKRPTEPNLVNGKLKSVISCILPYKKIIPTKTKCDIPRSEKSKRPRISQDEDECILITSSDDEDPASNTRKAVQHAPSEPLIKQIQKPSTCIFELAFNCWCIRIGSYECLAPASTFRVVFSNKGITFNVPHSQKPDIMVKVTIPNDSVLLIETHCGHPLPVMFLSIETSFAVSLRRRLEFSSDHHNPEFYYHPKDEDRGKKRITLLLSNHIGDEVRIIRKTFVGRIAEITYATATEIIHYSGHKDLLNGILASS